MKHFSTLRIRFALWTAALLAVVLLAFGAFVYLMLAHDLYSLVDASLQVVATQTAAALNTDTGQIDFTEIDPNGSVTADLQERGIAIRVLSPAGQILGTLGPYRDLPISHEILAAIRQQPLIFDTQRDPLSGQPIRVCTMAIADNSQLIGVVQVAQSLAGVHGTLERLLAALLIGVPLLVCVTAVGGYVLASRALAPIDAITRTARRISAEDLSARLHLPDTDDEVGRLASTFDEMLSRLHASFERERQFTLDASHELRTPLAAIQAILSVIRERRRNPEVYEHALADIAEEAERLSSLVEGLLHLARGEAGHSPAWQRVDLEVLLGDVTDSMRPLAEAKNLALDYSASGEMMVLGDVDLLICLFANLLDNAVKYTTRGGITVQAGLDPAGQQVRVTVSDTGSGIASEYLPHIFERFYRAETARGTRGAGLGLAIAENIVGIHGGTLEVHSTVDQGTTFTVVLPCAASAVSSDRFPGLLPVSSSNHSWSE